MRKPNETPQWLLNSVVRHENEHMHRLLRDGHERPEIARRMDLTAVLMDEHALGAEAHRVPHSEGVMKKPKKPIKVYFDGQLAEEPPFEVLEIVGRWNGWAIPRMTLGEAERCAAWLEKAVCGDVDDGGGDVAEEIRAVVPNADGTVTLNLGLTFWAVDEEPGEAPYSFAIPGLVLR